MTCLLALSLLDSRHTEFMDFLRITGFVPLAELSCLYVREMIGLCNELDDEAVWYVAVDDEGNPDMNIAYDLPTQLAGRLGTVIKEVRQQHNTSKVGILIYDLGTNKTEKHEKLELSQIERILSEWYAMGAPVCTVYHEFLRPETVENG